MHSILSTLSCLSLSCRTLSYPSELFLQYPCSYIFCSNQMVHTRSGSDQQQGQNNPGPEQPGYRDTDASTPDPGAVLPAPDADDGHPEQYCLGTSAGSHAASASSTTADRRQACRVSEGSPADVLPYI